MTFRLAFLAVVLGAGMAAGPAWAQAADAPITVPAGFRIGVFAEAVGPARHIAAAPNGDVYVALRRRAPGGGVKALRDSDGDGRADRIETFGDVEGTGIAIGHGYLYFGENRRVLRFKLADGDLAPRGRPEIVVDGFPEQRSHGAKSIALDQRGHIFVNVGAPSNACQKRPRSRRSPGLQPCPHLERQAGLWRFDALKTGQSFMDDGIRYATGVRNAVALDWSPSAEALYFIMHGRDQLDSLWPEYFSAEDNATRVAEEMHKAVEGGDYGWPYSYYDPIAKARMLAPEYGGDGKTRAEGPYRDPVAAFPAHWAPNDLLFYEAAQFPEAYRGGAFVAFHGSWNRAPQPQAGYKVIFVPMQGGAPSGDWRVFADGFAGRRPVMSPGNAKYRPMGLAVLPDGSLLIADSVTGRIWRVSYEGA